MKELSQSQIKQIHERIDAFIEEKGIEKKEGHIQTYFIVKVFEILGWTSKFSDINPHNEKATGKIPDIQLKNSKDETIFIIECKAGSKLENLNKTNKQGEKVYVNQLLKYCKDAGINWGVLTNFSEWQIYNTTTGKLYHNRKYELIKNGKANETDINDLFNMLLFENLKANNGKINTDPIYYATADDIKEDFFQKLKVWRADLRLYLQKSYSDKYSPIELDNQTQRILDRLIFISYCHKKKIISTDVLLSVLQASRKPFYEQLKIVFEDYNDKYNSDIFSEAICDNFKIDNEIIEPIISGINGIDFSQINVHIIGEVYENYLGELLKSSKSKPATDEIKEREKRKSHGIFYTPDYIVEYIVNNTIGEALKKCKTAKDVESLKIIDPACGSGSFLIKAFDVLYEKYVGFYRNKYGQLSAFAPLEISKKILTHNLFGVDLDDRAVEIAKLNLLLKALERIGDTQKTGRKILPNLSLNICVGNSLVSGKIEDDAIGDLFSSKSDYKSRLNALIAMKERFYHEDQSNEEMYRLLTEIKEREEEINNDFNEYLTANYFKKIDDIKPLNFEVKFCEIFKQGGFDCVIGNPPYLKLTSNNTKPDILKYYFDSYKSYHGGSSKNLFQLFIERIIKIKPNSFSFIVPEALLTTDSNKDLRDIMLDMPISSVATFDHFVFDDATIGSTIFVLDKNANKTTKHVISKGGKLKIQESIKIRKEDDEWDVSTNTAYKKLLNKITSNNPTLNELVQIAKGMVVQDRKSVLEENKTKNNLPFLLGKNMDRYFLEYDKYATYNRLKIIGGTNKLEKHIKTPRLLIRRTGDFICATYSNNPELVESTIYIVTSDTINLKYLLGVLNSGVLTFFLRQKLITNAQGYPQVLMGQLDRLPIKVIKDKRDKDIQNKIIKLVDNILVTRKLKGDNKLKISSASRQIDSLVYKLYGITDEKEIEIIENAVK